MTKLEQLLSLSPQSEVPTTFYDSLHKVLDANNLNAGIFARVDREDGNLYVGIEMDIEVSENEIYTIYPTFVKEVEWENITKFEDFGDYEYLIYRILDMLNRDYR